MTEINGGGLGGKIWAFVLLVFLVLMLVVAFMPGIGMGFALTTPGINGFLAGCGVMFFLVPFIRSLPEAIAPSMPSASMMSMPSAMPMQQFYRR